MMIGTYVLFLEAKGNLEPEVGRLGRVRIGKGLYAYVGSAMGRSVSLENRVKRHQEMASRKKGNKQWHIDYITTAPGVAVTGVARIVGKDIECEAAGLLEKSGGRAVAKGLGSSDCRCSTHFFSITEDTAEKFLRQLPDLF
jgi:Uri superfamily endonuclease